MSSSGAGPSNAPSLEHDGSGASRRGESDQARSTSLNAGDWMQTMQSLGASLSDTFSSDSIAGQNQEEEESSIQAANDSRLALNLQLRLIDEDMKDSKLSIEDDFSIAVDYQRNLVSVALGQVDDVLLSRSVDAAIESDTSSILAVLEEEEQGRKDRQYALRLAGNPSPATADFQPGAAQKRQCNVCLELCFPAAAAVECGHYICRTCLHELFSLALRDEELIPARCCNSQLGEDAAKKVLNAAQLHQYRTRVEELGVCTNRLYCPTQRCSRFLGSRAEAHERESVECPACRTMCCNACGLMQHTGACRPDPAAEERVKEWSKGKNVKQCKQCRRFIELVSGCNHMRCRCGFDFCFRCGEKWESVKCRNQSCSFWEEENL